MRPSRQPRRRSARGAGIALAATAAIACSTPAQRIDDYGRRQHFERVVERGEQFRHVLLRNEGPLIDGSLHIYLEGDGEPFINPIRVAPDPTTRKFLMLRLMALDPGRAVYVGRPCYQEVRSDPECSAQYWTLRRFSPEVIASLAAIIRREMTRAGGVSVQLFGHSGGGALAVLLTRELPTVRGVVTVAGNLDTDRWTRLHAYTPLAGSLNPVEVVLPPALALHTTHLAGAKDDVVPAALTREAAARIGGNVQEFADFTHTCCWETVWPAILSQHLSASGPRNYPARGTNRNSPLSWPASDNAEYRGL